MKVEGRKTLASYYEKPDPRSRRRGAMPDRGFLPNNDDPFASSQRSAPPRIEAAKMADGGVNIYKSGTSDIQKIGWLRLNFTASADGCFRRTYEVGGVRGQAG